MEELGLYGLVATPVGGGEGGIVDPNSHLHMNKSVIDGITQEMVAKWNKALPFEDRYVDDCNAWLTSGYIKTDTSTSNLPSLCTGDSVWGVLFYISENEANGTGTQMYFPIDGPYKGRIFTRNMFNRNGGQWNLVSTFDGDYNSLINKPDIQERVYDKYVVVAIAGQSNAVGYDESPVDTKFIYKNRDTSRIKQLGFYGNDNLQIIDLDYCAQSMQDMRAHNRAGTATAGTKGIHLPLANLMLDYIPDDYGVLLLPISFGGTGFTSGNVGTYSDILKKPTDAGAGNGTTAQKWGVDTPYYKTLRDRIIHVLNLNEQNLFAGIVWCQGENDKTNASGHYSGFTAMTDALFTALNNAGLGPRTPKGTFDKDIWYNLETVSYWYSQNQCQQIWDNYKTWNEKTYVEIPRDTESNQVNGTGQTTSNYPSHYGNNAYQKVIAPRVLQKMIDMNTFSKKVNVVNVATVEEEIRDDFYPVDLEAPRIVHQADITVKGNTTFTVNADNTCSASQDLQGKFVIGSNEICVDFGNIAEMEWTVSRWMYWMIIEGDINGNYLLLGIGGSNTGQLAKIENGALSILENANQHTKWYYYFKAGDRVRVYRNFDGSLTLYRTNGANGVFQKWFEYENKNIYEQKTLGFACGISAVEFNSPFNTEKRIIFSDMKIKEVLSLIDYKTYELAMESLGVKDVIFDVTIQPDGDSWELKEKGTSYTSIKKVLDAGGTVYLRDTNTNNVIPLSSMSNSSLKFTMETTTHQFDINYSTSTYGDSTMLGIAEKSVVDSYTVNVTGTIASTECAVLAYAANKNDFLVFHNGKLIDSAKFLYLKRSSVKWYKANSAWSETATDDLPDKCLCLHDGTNGVEPGTYSYIII